MRLDLYLQETRVLTQIQSDLLAEVCEKLKKGNKLSRLEENGVLHALQILIENAIGKAKHLLKAYYKTVPISAYETFATLVDIKYIAKEDLSQWNAIIGLRNKIVHDYMNMRMELVLELVKKREYQIVVDFLYK